MNVIAPLVLIAVIAAFLTAPVGSKTFEYSGYILTVACTVLLFMFLV